MKNKNIGIFLAVVGMVGAIGSIILLSFIEPCCTLFYASYNQILTFLIPTFVIIMGSGMYLYFKPEKKTKVVRTRITKILTLDEKNVINQLKRKDNITQADLRRELGYSKAKLSMLLEKMQKRSLIKKIKRGRTNIVVLKRKL